MKFFSKEFFNDVNAIFSFASALIPIVQLILQVPWYYIVISLGAVLYVWFFICRIRLRRRPWHRKMRNPLIQRSKNSVYPFSVFLKTVFTKPYYETSFIIPHFNNNMDINEIFPINTSRLTVVIEDDPVGYADNIGMLPCIPVDDAVSNEDLYHRIKSLDKEITKYNMFFIATPSRRLSAEKSLVLNREIGLALRRYLGQRTQQEVRIISKIDSCLRSYIFRSIPTQSEAA